MPLTHYSNGTKTIFVEGKKKNVFFYHQFLQIWTEDHHHWSSNRVGILKSKTINFMIFCCIDFLFLKLTAFCLSALFLLKATRKKIVLTFISFSCSNFSICEMRKQENMRFFFCFFFSFSFSFNLLKCHFNKAFRIFLK